MADNADKLPDGLPDKLPGVIGFRLKKSRDADIIAWLQGLPKDDRSYHIRAALRVYMASMAGGAGGWAGGAAGGAAVLPPPPPARQETGEQPAAVLPTIVATGSGKEQEPEPLPAAEPKIDDDKLEQALSSWAG